MYVSEVWPRQDSGKEKCQEVWRGDSRRRRRESWRRQTNECGSSLSIVDGLKRYTKVFAEERVQEEAEEVKKKRKTRLTTRGTGKRENMQNKHHYDAIRA